MISNQNIFLKYYLFLLNKMIIGIFNGKTTISSAFIRCYFQYVFLFKKLCLEFEEEYTNYVNHILNLIKKNNYEITKEIIPDIGNFFMLLFFSNKDTHTEKMEKMWYILFEESSTRKSFWIFHGEECRLQMKKLIFKDRTPSIDDICLKRFEEDITYDINHNDIFIQDLKDKKIFNIIIDIINNDANFETINIYNYDSDDLNYGRHIITDPVKKRKIIIDKIENNFKNLFIQCSKESQNKISWIISEKLKFSNYCWYERDSTFIKYEEKAEIRNILYDSCRVNELLKDKKLENMDEILKYAFDSQKGNKLLIITFLTAKKIENKEFMKELEENYGIYLEVDLFIKEMNQKLKEIESFSEMYEFIGSEFGTDDDDLEIIINSYERAKKKGYFSDPYKSLYNKNNNNFRGGFNRGRGNLRGSRGGRGRGNKRGS